MSKEYVSPEALLDDLNCKYMSLTDYNNAIESGMIVRMKPFEDDMKFQLFYPDHPRSADNRFRRIDAADSILYSARQNMESLLPITIINEHIHDCCAAVRLSLVQTLFYIGDKSSEVELEKLLIIEKESNMVKESILSSLEKIRQI